MTTLLHLPFDELALPGSNLLPDVSPYRKVANIVGGAKLLSGALSLDGLGSYVTASAGFDLGGGDFTIEFGIETTDSNFVPVDAYTGAASGWQIFINASGRLVWWTNGVKKTGSIPINNGARRHVAVVRESGYLQFYVDGGPDGLAVSHAASQSSGSGVLGVGAQVYQRNNAYDLSGAIDYLRISDTALYTEPFTPPVVIPYTPWTIGFSATGVVHRYSPYEDGPPVCSQVGQTKRLIEDIHYGGRGIIAKTVKLKGTPANTPLVRRVRLFRDRDAVCVGETWSDAAGNYVFSHIDAAEKYTAISYDHTGALESVCASGLVPDLLP